MATYNKNKATMQLQQDYRNQTHKLNLLRNQSQRMMFTILEVAIVNLAPKTIQKLKLK